MSTLSHNHSLGLLVMRLTLGGLMLFHGVAKIVHPDSMDFIAGTLSNVGLPTFIAYGIYLGELLAPIMIIMGVFSRFAGVVIVVNMLFAVLLVHTGDVLVLAQNGAWRLESQAFYLFSALAIVLMGSGRYAVKPD